MELSTAQEKEMSQTASRQDTIAESQTCGQTETVLLKNQGLEIEKFTDIANTLLARDYKGFDNQGMNGVIEVERK